VSNKRDVVVWIASEAIGIAVMLGALVALRSRGVL
jgi:hypothetical protein